MVGYLCGRCLDRPRVIFGGRKVSSFSGRLGKLHSISTVLMLNIGIHSVLSAIGMLRRLFLLQLQNSKTLLGMSSFGLLRQWLRVLLCLSRQPAAGLSSSYPPPLHRPQAEHTVSCVHILKSCFIHMYSQDDGAYPSAYDLLEEQKDELTSSRQVLQKNRRSWY